MDPGVVTGVSIVILWGYVAIWYYWRGKNWARIFVMFTSVLTLIDLLITVVLFVLHLSYSASVPYYLVIVANGVLGSYLLYLLNTKDVRIWFGKSKPDPRVLL